MYVYVYMLCHSCDSVGFLLFVTASSITLSSVTHRWKRSFGNSRVVLTLGAQQMLVMVE